MAKTKISEFSATPANNTDIDSINIAEGCAPSGINDAIRELMAQLKDFQTGAVGDSFNGPIGTSTAAAGAFTTLAASGSVTLSGGTANGVTYLNGSKVLTSGSALTWSGTLLSATTSVSGNSNVLSLINSNAAAGGQGVGIYGYSSNGSNSLGSIQFGGEGALGGNLDFSTANSSGTNTLTMRLSSSGNLGIGTSSPNSKLDVTTNSTNTDGITLTADGTSFGYASNIYFRSKLTNGGSIGLAARISAALSSANNAGLLFYTTASGTNALAATLDGAGNLGLGATSITPRDSGARTLELYGTSSGRTAIKFTNSTSGTGATDGMFLGYDDNLNFSIVNNESGVITFGTSNTERARIDSSGRFGVGTSSPASYGGSAFTKSVNIGSLNTITAGFSDEVTGTFRIAHASGQNILNFDTSALCFQSGGSTPTERARITSAGNLLVGTTSATGFQDGLSLYKATGNSQLIVGHGNGAASGNAYALFYYNGTVIGSITQSGTTAVLYNTTSDQRLKENIQNADSASSLIDSLQVRKFDWKADGSHQRYGFVAQELVTVYPEAVHQPIDTEDMMAVDYSKLVPLLVKEIQSLKARLDAANL